ncbi:MAG TPA: PqiC family protein [Thermoanaerobaculia bacterium]|nr:PqiC family protein [Thermoanaerobaculia bacterium]
MKRLVFLVLLAGCSFLKRPPNQFFSLDTIPPEGAVAQAAGAPIGIDALELAPGLDRRGIVVQGADHKLEVRGTHQWSAPLEEMVTHTLAFDLANRLPEGMVVLPGQPKPAGAMRSLAVEFEELAAGPETKFVLDARWTIGAATTHERIEVPMESLESAQIAAAFSRALAMLADRIAASLARS